MMSYDVNDAGAAVQAAAERQAAAEASATDGGGNSTHYDEDGFAASYEVCSALVCSC